MESPEVWGNLLKRVQGKDLRNNEDIFDITSSQGVATEIINEKEVEDLERQTTLEAIKTFCDVTEIKFGERFRFLLAEYFYGKETKIPNFLESGKHILPKFDIYDHVQANQVLKEVGLEIEWGESEDYLLIFNLPKPLAEFWWKGGTEYWGNQGEDVGTNITEWGHFYRELMPVIWERVGFEECEGELSFERLNDIGEHNPSKFYYVWRITKRNVDDEY